jgi:dipeptidyl aminopeptidase/acylaminoacyl peptidase
MSCRLLFLLPLFLLLPAPAAEPTSDPSRWTVDDVVLAGWDDDFQLAPTDGSVVWVQTEVDAEKGRYENLMRANLKSGRKVQLTRGKYSVSRPRWSPDGKYLAFLSDRPDPEAKSDKPAKSRAGKRAADKDSPVTQVWLLDTTGGEPWALTKGERAVQTFDWAGNDAIVFAAQEDASERETRLKDDKDTSHVVEDDKHNPPVRLFRVDIEKEKTTRLSDNRDTIDLLSVSPDGKFALVVHGQTLRYTYDNRTKPIVRLHDLTKGTSEKVLAPQIVPTAFHWALDGSGCYVVYDWSSQMEFNQAGVTRAQWFDLATRKASEIDLDWDRGIASQGSNASRPGLVPVKDGFVALLSDGAHTRLAHYKREGETWKREPITGDHVGNIFAIEVARDGDRLLYAHSTASIPTQWYQAALTGNKLEKGKALTEVPESLVEKKKAKTEVIRWKGALDEEVEGILYYPHDYQKGKRYPLIVAIHGGPSGADYDSWDESWAYTANLYCQRGAFVLKPNYHGSSDYGPKWLESITRGKYCDLEPIDIDRGVDHLIAQGLVDKDRLGILGWSNGSILTSLITTQTTRYKAAAAGAGTVEYISDWANCEFGDAFDRFYLGKSALEDPAFYKAKSPFFNMHKVTTPTLIFHGTDDRVVPTEQGWVYYRALQQLGKVEVKFVLFPDEAHSLKKVAHQKRKLTEELAWFDRHLFGTFKEVTAALKKDSPLAALVARSKASNVAGQFGVKVEGVLIPEVVPYKGVTVGRFEVTRAQFAQFDPKYPLPAGTENRPAVVTFEQARDYCKWVSQKTGAKYRLPDEKEADTIYPDDGDGENTLDYWAGYAVNPDDAARLLNELKALPGETSLLRAAGTFKGRGDPAVFDLGGNVAEWTIGEDGKGVLRGGSADRPTDSKAKGEAGVGYRGFRVVREK